MKIFICALWTLAPVLAYAQNEDELKKDMDKRLKELDEKFNRERARIKEEFEQKLRDRKEPERRTEGGNLMERLEKRLADLDKRLDDLERKLGGGENVKKFFRENFDWNPKDMDQWMEKGRKMWENQNQNWNNRNFKFQFQGEPREILKNAKEVLEQMLQHHDGDSRERLNKIVEELKRIIEKSYREEEPRKEKPRDRDGYY